MYPKSIWYAIVGMLPAAFLAACPVQAQEKFASQLNVSFLAANKSSPRNLLAYYSLGEAPLETNSPRQFFSSSATVSRWIKEALMADDSKGYGDNHVGNMANDFPASNYKVTYRRTSFVYPFSYGKDLGIAAYSIEQLTPYVVLLKEYAKKHGYDTSFAFLSNMGMKTNSKRFFVVDLASMEIVSSGLVAQGRGQGWSRFDRQYSNKTDSRCTALGHYKVTKKYRGEYGQAYKMIGLDSSNSNAYRRNIVLHSMGCMADEEDNAPVCISEGCPAVSINFLSSLSKIIDSSRRPVLLWIFDSNLEEAVMEKKDRVGDANGSFLSLRHRSPIHFDTGEMNHCLR